MTGKRAFQPSVVAGASQLEARVVLSHTAAHHLFVPLVHAGVHHHVAPPHVIKVHEKTAHHGAKEGKNTRPSALSNPTPPIIVLPISTQTEDSPPSNTGPSTASVPDSGSPSGTTTISIPTVLECDVGRKSKPSSTW